jgi:hypothetical protein
MRYALKALVILLGLVFLGLGARYLLDPVGTGEEFGVRPLAANGYATLRADMFALFGVCGAAALFGGWRDDRKLLLVPVVICVLALIGRLISYFVEGASVGMVQAMAVEVIAAVILLAASQVLPGNREVASGD